MGIIDMEDDFEHALKEAEMPVSSEFAKVIKENLHFIRARYPHKERMVDSCLKGLGENPPLMRVLVAAYVLNGGVSLKYNMSEAEQSPVEDAEEFERLLQEIKDLDALPPELDEEEDNKEKKKA